MKKGKHTMIRHLQYMLNTSTVFDCSVFLICFWIAQSILEAKVSTSLILHSLLFSFVILLSIRLITPMLIKPVLAANVVFQRLRINAIGLSIGASILLLLNILLAWSDIATMMLASVLVFFVLGTLSPLKLENKLLH